MGFNPRNPGLLDAPWCSLVRSRKGVGEGVGGGSQEKGEGSQPSVAGGWRQACRS